MLGELVDQVFSADYGFFSYQVCAGQFEVCILYQDRFIPRNGLTYMPHRGNNQSDPWG
jgi:hypothetical protein